ncbi:MAG TPA: hypothetical protein VM450_18305 [Thermomicrobiales bacterium]|nr:hypothetical protein [Thermomicrobiales bacterium]
MTQEQLAAEALATYDRAETALQAGDWATYGAEQERLRQILELLNQGQATPVP